MPYLRRRLIPVLQINQRKLVKTRKFLNSTYIGDPLNAIRIFNDLKVDELKINCINSYLPGFFIDYEYVSALAEHCFIPISYGGGVSTVEQALRLLKIGVEKITISTSAIENPNFISELSTVIGAQSLSISIDYKYNLMGRPVLTSRSGTKKHSGLSLHAFASRCASLGVGELCFSCINRDGSLHGLDAAQILPLVQELPVPCLINCGCSSYDEVSSVFQTSPLSGVCASSLFLFRGPHKAVMINYQPTPDDV